MPSSWAKARATGVALMAFAVNEEIIIPGFLFRRPGFYFGEIDLIFHERGQHRMQSAYLVLDGKYQRSAV